MSETSRRKFLAVAGAGAAAGTVGVAVGGPASAARATRGPHASTEPVVAYIENPHAGVVHLMVGDRELIVEDHDLAARILNAAGGK